MKKSLYFLFLISVVPFDLIGQDTTVNKRNLMRIFKNNAKGTTFDWKKRDWSNDANSTHLSNYQYWTTCNTDSIYYKLDTLTFLNHKHDHSKLGCEWYKKWCIDSKKRVFVMETMPAINTAARAFGFRVVENGASVFIEINTGKELIDLFLVIGLNLTYLDKEKKEKCYELTLKRIKASNNKPSNALKTVAY